MEDTHDSGYNNPLGIIHRIQGNLKRRNVRPASSCATNKNDVRGTTVVNDSDSEVPDNTSQDYDDDYDGNDGSPQSGPRDDQFFNSQPNQDLGTCIFSEKLFLFFTATFGFQ